MSPSYHLKTEPQHIVTSDAPSTNKMNRKGNITASSTSSITPETYDNLTERRSQENVSPSRFAFTKDYKPFKLPNLDFSSQNISHHIYGYNDNTLTKTSSFDGLSQFPSNTNEISNAQNHLMSPAISDSNGESPLPSPTLHDYTFSGNDSKTNTIYTDSKHIRNGQLLTPAAEYVHHPIIEETETTRQKTRSSIHNLSLISTGWPRSNMSITPSSSKVTSSSSCNTTPTSNELRGNDDTFAKYSNTLPFPGDYLNKHEAWHWGKRSTLTPTLGKPPNDFNFSKDEITKIIKEIHSTNIKNDSNVNSNKSHNNDSKHDSNSYDHSNKTDELSAVNDGDLINCLSKASPKSLRSLNQMKIIQWYCCQCGKSYGDLDHFITRRGDIPDLIMKRSKSAISPSIFSADELIENTTNHDPHHYSQNQVSRTNSLSKGQQQSSYSASKGLQQQHTEQIPKITPTVEAIQNEKLMEPDSSDYDDQADSALSDEIVEILLGQTVNRFDCARCSHMMCPYCVKARLSDLVNR